MPASKPEASPSPLSPRRREAPCRRFADTRFFPPRTHKPNQEKKKIIMGATSTLAVFAGGVFMGVFLSQNYAIPDLKHGVDWLVGPTFRSAMILGSQGSCGHPAVDIQKRFSPEAVLTAVSLFSVSFLLLSSPSRRVSR